jgi:hypothetical protein
MPRPKREPATAELDRLHKLNAKLASALGAFVDYYDQVGIGPCRPKDADDPPDGFDGDEVFNVRYGRRALVEFRRQTEQKAKPTIT